MRVTCPHCQRTVTLDDKFAEQAAQCPACNDIFTAPSLMNALPDGPKPTPETPPPPPPFTPVAPSVVAAQPPGRSDSSAAQTTPAGGMRFTIKKTVVRWLGPVGIVLLFLLSFFNWVGAYPPGYSVYTQSAWQIMTGGFTTNDVADEVFGRKQELDSVSHFGNTMFLVLIVLLIPATLIAIADLAEEYITFTVPDIIQSIWPHRLTLLSVASLIIFGLLTARCVFGLGLETAVVEMAEKQVAVPKLDSNAPPETAKDKAKRDLQRSKEIAQLSIQRTFWWRLAYSASALAVIGYGLELMLQRRGRRPEPVVEVHW